MIHIFCALYCEAEPLIQHFKLTELKQFDLFRLFQSKDKTVTLSISGIGKTNMAAAVCYHHACFNTKQSDIWLNIGVAGHENTDIGKIRLVNKITDEHDRTCWYPQIIFDSPCKQSSLVSLDKPSNQYQNILFDMEAAGFYQMAIRLGTAELIHCIKIISDNAKQPTHTVNTGNVKKMIGEKKDMIETIISLLHPFSKELELAHATPEHYETFIEQWHFTESQQFQLLRLLRQWSIRLPKEQSINYVKKLKTGKEILKALNDKLTNSPFTIYQ